MGEIYEHWRQHMDAAAANFPGAQVANNGKITAPSADTMDVDAMVIHTYVLPLLVGFVNATDELVSEVDRLRAEVDELKRPTR